MKSAFSGKKSWLWIVGLLVLLGGVNYLAMSDQPEAYPPYTPDSPSPSGLKAFYTYMEELNDNVETWDDAPGQLVEESDQGRQLLIMIEPDHLEDSEIAEHYMNYIESGQTILLVKRDLSGLLNANTNVLETSFIGDVKDSEGVDYEADVMSSTRLRVEADDEVLLSDDGGAIALKRSYGDGTLIAVNTPSWFTNENILEKDHLPLVLGLLEDAGGTWDQILFEAAHGSQDTAAAWTDIYPFWIIVLSLFVVVWTVLWLWFKGKRFGRIVTPREATVRFSDERVKALGAWYLRTKSYSEALAIQADYLKTRMQENWGISYRRSWHDRHDHLVRRLDEMSEKDVRAFVTGLEQVLQKDTINKQEFLLWSKQIDSVRREVEK
ncbi:DUF4350 domain-containing protein [Lentibacillus saliphilus]|uniref:DUF4350 domain-containing protein n=1 Tax=Lentibacillus saliphilus TaxID=2737028 RepID=UPI001C2FABAC|nr:DUF4350 domain-containing protein [Lentibacillus saliphilus]